MPTATIRLVTTAGTIDPKGQTTGEKRVLRGGYYNSEVTGIRSALRYSRTPSADNGVDGYRLCAPVPAEGSNTEASL